MLIVSWNVAGLSTTVDRIHEAFSALAVEEALNAASNPKKQKPSPSLAMSYFLERHNIDILCVQEHKIPHSKLSSRCEPRGCSSIEGFESFWSCNLRDEKNIRGMNGVVTYARQGMVVSANAIPLGCDELDKHGRCVMTDHGDVVIFNVYVPSSGQPLSFKMRFLNALKRAMDHQRNIRKKKVILAGDLNISRGALDQFWQHRRVFIDEILNEARDAEGQAADDTLAAWKADVVRGWPQMLEALETKEIVSTQTTNPTTNQKLDRYRAAIQVNGKRVFLGNHEPSREYCEYCYDLEPYSYTCDDTKEEVLAKEGNTIGVGVLAELLLKVVGVNWSELVQREISENHAGVSKVAPPRKWLDSIITDDKMVDTFRHFYPQAKGRFTCWNQSKNKRYCNEGSRIDYILVDEVLMSHVEKGDVESLRCDGPCSNPLHEDAALRAATANGKFQAASYEGGGIQESTQAALESQFGVLHTGMIYTPPTFSDHIGVSLLMADSSSIPRNLTLNQTDRPTKLSQPHKAQRSIKSFFSTEPKVSNKGRPVTQNHSKPATNRKRPSGIERFFVSKNQKGG